MQGGVAGGGGGGRRRGYAGAKRGGAGSGGAGIRGYAGAAREAAAAKDEEDEKEAAAAEQDEECRSQQLDELELVAATFPEAELSGDGTGFAVRLEDLGGLQLAVEFPRSYPRRAAPRCSVRPSRQLSGAAALAALQRDVDAAVVAAHDAAGGDECSALQMLLAAPELCTVLHCTPALHGSSAWDSTLSYYVTHRTRPVCCSGRRRRPGQCSDGSLSARRQAVSSLDPPRKPTALLCLLVAPTVWKH